MNQCSHFRRALIKLLQLWETYFHSQNTLRTSALTQQFTYKVYLQPGVGVWLNYTLNCKLKNKFLCLVMDLVAQKSNVFSHDDLIAN